MHDSLPAQQPYVTKDGSLILELVHPRFAPGIGVSLAEAVVEAGSDTERHLHADFDEIYYCLEGSGIVFVNDSSYPFTPNSFRLIPRGASHHLTAETKLRLLCVCNPAYTHEETVLLDR